VTSGSGDYFCLDMNPLEPKRVGQVLLFLRDQPGRPLIAGSLRAWFDRIARDLEAGLYTFNEENGFMVRPLCGQPSRKSIYSMASKANSLHEIF